jgi:hypothetical protein
MGGFTARRRKVRSGLRKQSCANNSLKRDGFPSGNHPVLGARNAAFQRTRAGLFRGETLSLMRIDHQAVIPGHDEVANPESSNGFSV